MQNYTRDEMESLFEPISGRKYFLEIRYFMAYTTIKQGWDLCTRPHWMHFLLREVLWNEMKLDDMDASEAAFASITMPEHSYLVDRSVCDQIRAALPNIFD